MSLSLFSSSLSSFLYCPLLLSSLPSLPLFIPSFLAAFKTVRLTLAHLYFFIQFLSLRSSSISHLLNLFLVLAFCTSFFLYFLFPSFCLLFLLFITCILLPLSPSFLNHLNFFLIFFLLSLYSSSYYPLFTFLFSSSTLSNVSFIFSPIFLHFSFTLSPLGLLLTFFEIPSSDQYLFSTLPFPSVSALSLSLLFLLYIYNNRAMIRFYFISRNQAFYFLSSFIIPNCIVYSRCLSFF